MNIRAKVLLTSFTVLGLLSVGLILGMIYHFHQLTRLEIAEYRKEEIAKTQARLRDMVELAYTALEGDYRRLHDNAYIAERYGERLRNIVDLAENTIHYHLQAAARQGLSATEGRQQALEAVRQLRYGEKGYLWINDTARPYPTMILHPAIPSLEGQVMDDPQYANLALNRSTHVFTAILDVCAERGEGFIDYPWIKPTGGEVRKLSYVRLLPELGWIIGTGVYLDEAKRNLVNKIKENIRKMRYDDGTGYFWIQNSARPPVMVMHAPHPELEGTSLLGKSFPQPDGRNLGTMTVDAVAKSGAGFMEYAWPKAAPDGTMTPQPKMAFLRYFEPLDWIIGSAIYIDAIDAAVAKKTAEHEQQLRNLGYQMIGYSLLVFLAVAIILSVFLQRILLPLTWVGRHLALLSKGRVPPDSIHYHGRDEIRTLVDAYTGLRDRVSATIRQAKAVAAGDYRHVAPPDQQDELSTALGEMTDALRLAAERSARQDWLKTGQNRLHGAMRGDHDLADLAREVVLFLHDYLAATPVLFYCREAHEDSLKLMASQGFERRKTLSAAIRPGEALVGQAAVEKSLIVVEAVKAEESEIQAPFLLAIPFFHEETVIGVVEMGRQAPFDDTHLEFLKTIMTDIAVAVRVTHLYRR